MNCMDCKNRYKYVSASDCKEFLCNNFEPKERPKLKPKLKENQIVHWDGELFGCFGDEKDGKVLIVNTYESERKRMCYHIKILDNPSYKWGVEEDSLSPLEPQSAHKAGEVFDDEWEYAGKKTNIARIGETIVCDDGTILKIDVGEFEFNSDFNNGYREILRPRKKKVKDKRKI